MSNVHFVTDNPLMFYLMNGDGTPLLVLCGMILITLLCAWVYGMLPWRIKQSDAAAKAFLAAVVVSNAAFLWFMFGR
jgi:uncharacterized membrane protein YecN with MAPEG domain